MREPQTSRWRARLSQPKRFLLLYRSVRLRYCEFQIPATPESPPLQGVYIGEGLSLPYYLKLYKAEVNQEKLIPVWRVPGAISRALASIPVVLVEINRLLDSMLPAGGLRADCWIEQETDLNGVRYRQRRRAIEEGWGRKVRQHNLRYTLSSDEGDLSLFYREFYRPHIEHRHGDASAPRDLDTLKHALRTGFLLQVWHEDRWISGLVVSRSEKHRVSLLATGLRLSDRHRMKDGAVSAVYYFLFKWAKENGAHIVNFCGSRPNQMDGVFIHKRLWGALPKHDPWHHTEIVFFLAPGICLPESIQKQLVAQGDGFISIEELRGAQR